MKPNLIVTCFALMIIADVLTSMAFNLGLSFWNIGFFVKTPIELLFIGLLLRFKQFHFVLVILAIVFLCWFVGFTTSYINFGGVRDSSYALDFGKPDTEGNPYLVSFTILNRYILFFALVPMLLLHTDNDRFLIACKKIFESFLYVNSLAIIIGFLFKIQLFSSYNPQAINDAFEARFGYKGLLYGINEVTGIYFLGVAYSYREIFHYGKNKYVLLALLLGASLLTGAKGCLISACLLSIYYLFKYKRILFYSVVGPITLAGILYLIKIDLIDQLSSMLNIYLTLDGTTPFNAFLTYFMTGRNLYIEYNWSYMLSHWNVLNYIFGDGILYSETDLFDLYYFFGFGSLIYLYGYVKLIFYRKTNPDIKYIFLFLLLIALTGGHLIRSGVFPVFFSLYLITGYLSKNYTQEAVEENNVLAP